MKGTSRPQADLRVLWSVKQMHGGGESQGNVKNSSSTTQSSVQCGTAARGKKIKACLSIFMILNDVFI